MIFFCMNKLLKIIFLSLEFMICFVLYKFIKSRVDQKFRKMLKKEKKDFMKYWFKEMNLEYSLFEFLVLVS